MNDRSLCGSIMLNYIGEENNNYQLTQSFELLDYDDKSLFIVSQLKSEVPILYLRVSLLVHNSVIFVFTPKFQTFEAFKHLGI